MPEVDRRLRVGRPRHVEEALAAREKRRPSVRGLAPRRVELGHGGRRAAGRGYAEEALVTMRRVDDRAVLSPGSAAGLDHVRQVARRRRARRRLDDLELASGEKTDRAAVGRPERKDRLLPAGHHIRLQSVHFANPETMHAVRLVGAERKPAAVRRKRDAADARAQGVEVRVRWRRKVSAQDGKAGTRRRAMRPPEDGEHEARAREEPREQRRPPPATRSGQNRGLGRRPIVPDSLKLEPDVARGLPPVVGILGKTGPDDSVERRRAHGRERRDRRRLLFHDR